MQKLVFLSTMLTAYIAYNVPVDFKGFKNNHNITIVCIYLLGPEGIELKFRLRFYLLCHI